VGSTPIVARLPADAAVHVGDTCPVSVNTGLSHLFDPTTERRIVAGEVPAAAN
jgi:hypothetical protein